MSAEVISYAFILFINSRKDSGVELFTEHQSSVEHPPEVAIDAAVFEDDPQVELVAVPRNLPPVEAPGDVAPQPLPVNVQPQGKFWRKKCYVTILAVDLDALFDSISSAGVDDPNILAPAIQRSWANLNQVIIQNKLIQTLF